MNDEFVCCSLSLPLYLCLATVLPAMCILVNVAMYMCAYVHEEKGAPITGLKP